MNAIETLDVLKKVDNEIMNEPEGINRDTFCKYFIEIINEAYIDNLPFELEVDKQQFLNFLIIYTCEY